MNIDINKSAINFADLVPANQTNEPKPVVNQLSAWQKKKAREPVIEARPDNVSTFDPDIEAKLSRFYEESSAKEPETTEPDITQDILVEPETPAQTTAKTSAKTTKSKAKAPAKPKKKAESTSAVDPDSSVPTVQNTDESKLNHEVSEDDVALNKRIMTIHHYQNSAIFGPHLKSLGVKYTTEQLNKKDMKGLDKIISQIRVMCSSKQNTSALDSMLFGGTQMVENIVSSRSKYDLHGWTMMLKQDQNFLEAWELIKIERLSFARMTPEVQFAYSLAVNALAVVNINKAMAVKNGLPQAQQTVATPAEPPKQPTGPTLI